MNAFYKIMIMNYEKNYMYANLAVSSPVVHLNTGFPTRYG